MGLQLTSLIDSGTHAIPMRFCVIYQLLLLSPDSLHQNHVAVTLANKSIGPLRKILALV